MLKKVQGASHPFTPFYHNNALLIQLMITEMINIHQIQLNLVGFNNELEKLSTQLSSLIGDFAPSELIPHTCKGSLNRLKNYALIYSHHYSASLPLLKLVNQTCINVVQNLLLINELQTKTPEVDQLPLLKRQIKSLIVRLKKLPKSLTPLLQDFQKNEEVIYFLLCKKDPLSRLFGKGYLQKFFQSLSYETTLEKWLIDRYQTNGFYDLIPFIKQELSFQGPSLHANI